MLSDKRSDSFTFHSPKMVEPTQKEVELVRVTRRRLQDRFDNECPYSLQSTKPVNTTQKRWANLNFSSVSLPPIHPRRVLRSGADKLSQTLNNFRTTFGTLSQKFRNSTRRRYRLKESPHSPVTPQSRSRHILGRTPTKLYSPFGIESPYQRKTRNGQSRNKENGMNTGRYTPRHRSCTRSSYYNSPGGIGQGKAPGTSSFSMYSPHQKFGSDLEEVRIGIWEFDQTANSIVRRSLRH